jgi:hypothetical protein
VRPLPALGRFRVMRSEVDRGASVPASPSPDPILEERGHAFIHGGRTDHHGVPMLIRAEPFRVAEHVGLMVVAADRAALARPDASESS